MPATARILRAPGTRIFSPGDHPAGRVYILGGDVLPVAVQKSSPVVMPKLRT